MNYITNIMNQQRIIIDTQPETATVTITVVQSIIIIKIAIMVIINTEI